MRGRVLVVAGSDSGGGAGIQADLKATLALGAYASTAITALTAQDTEGVRAVHPVPLDFLRLQVEMALADPGADAVKTGMLADAPTIALVADLLAALAPGLPLVADPVMVAKGGARLLDPGAVGTMRERLLPLATLLTPNAPEAEALTGEPVRDEAGQRRAAARLLALGARSVLVKGGHLPGAVVRDLLATAEGFEVFESPRVETRHTHGTGCTLAAACAAGLAQGRGLRDSVRRALAYVSAALREAPGIGRGHGPLNHAVTLDPARLAALG